MSDFNLYLKGYSNSLRNFLRVGRMKREFEIIREITTIDIPTITFHKVNTINIEPDLEYEFFKPVKEESRMDRENEFEE